MDLWEVIPGGVQLLLLVLAAAPVAGLIVLIFRRAVRSE